MKFILFYLPSVGTLSQTKQGMAGINSQNYQNMLWQVSEQIKFADRAGFWGAAFTEHHFHIEGIEESNNPILLDLYFGMQTTRIRLAATQTVTAVAKMSDGKTYIDQKKVEVTAGGCG